MNQDKFIKSFRDFDAKYHQSGFNIGKLLNYLKFGIIMKVKNGLILEILNPKILL